jgi:hypothetical protein
MAIWAIDGTRKNFSLTPLHTLAIAAHPYFAETGGDRKPHLIGLLTERIGKTSGQVPLAVAVNADVIRETLQLLDRHERSVSGSGSLWRSDQTPPNQSNARLSGSRAGFIRIIHSKPLALVPLATGSRE